MQYQIKATQKVISCECGKNELTYIGITTNGTLNNFEEQYSYVFKCQNKICLRKFHINENFEETPGVRK